MKERLRRTRKWPIYTKPLRGGGQIRDICPAHQKSLTKVKLCLRLKLQSGYSHQYANSSEVSAECWLPIDRYADLHSADISIEMCRSTYRPTYRSSVGRDIGRYVGRHVDRHISIDTSAERRSIYRPTYRSRGAQTTDGPYTLEIILYITAFHFFSSQEKLECCNDIIGRVQCIID